MNNYYLMTAEFERQKNVKASAITLGIAGALLLLFILVKWPLPTLPQPALQEFIEIDLGNGDPGSGTDHPLLPGEPAPAVQETYTPPQPVQSTVADAKDVETDDREDNIAPAIRRPAVSNPKATKIDNDNKVVKATNNTTPAVTNPAPARPRAVLGRTVGGNGNGGNGADTYSPGTGGPGGNGNGNGGSGGGPGTGNGPRRLEARVVSIPPQSFEDDFKEGGTVALEISVDDNGVLQSANYSARGSSLPRSSKQTSIALQRVRQIRFPKYDGGFKQTLTFNFTVR